MPVSCFAKIIVTVEIVLFAVSPSADVPRL